MNSFINVSNILPRIPDVKFPEPISFTMNRGDVWTFYGPNGSGKSTTISCILGLLKYDKGEVKVFPTTDDLNRFKTLKKCFIKMKRIWF